MTGLLPILACLVAASLLSGVKNGDGERMTHEWRAANVGVAAPDANDQEMSLPRRKILCLQVKQFDFFVGKALKHSVLLLSQGFSMVERSGFESKVMLCQLISKHRNYIKELGKLG